MTEKYGTATTGGGRHVEFGYGLALGKIMICVGEREHVFAHLPSIRFFDTEEAAVEYVACGRPREP